LAFSIGWSLGKRASTWYIALANVEPVARNFPLWNHHVRHCKYISIGVNYVTSMV
jgi:hypothetical protein